MSASRPDGGAGEDPVRGSAAPVLAFEGVSKSFSAGFIPRRKQVLSNLSFSVGKSEVFGFLGANGAGKTTTIKLLVGLLFPDRGHIRIRGVDAREPRARQALGFLPENPYFYDDLSGREFLDFYGRLSGLDAGTRRKRSDELLERLSLGHAAGVKLRSYSKGMVQRIGFAQALLARPDLLVLDEPMSGLDPIGRRDFRDLMLEVRAAGATVFFSSHILQDAEMLCDRVAILNGGRLVRVGNLGDLLTGSGTGYEVGVQGVAPAALEAVGRAVAVSGGAAGRTLFRVASLAEAEELMRRAREAGGQVVSLVPVRATLEELFLREVGADDDAQGTPAAGAAESARRAGGAS